MNDIKQLTKYMKNIRNSIIEMAYRTKSAHLGGSLSCVEILTALYFNIMHVTPENPNNHQRDRLIFSKAHDAMALYAALAERGFISKKVLGSYEMNDGLPGHSTRFCIPGVESTAGSLGHGLSIANGIAYAGKIDKKSYKVFAILSDGECDEGSTWEAILFAGHHKLDNLIAIIDYNKLQSFGFTKDILNLEPLSDKFKNFGWEVKETDGHDIKSIIQSLSKLPFVKNKPSMLIAHTIKGFAGIEKYINTVSSHYKPPTSEEYKDFIKTK